MALGADAGYRALLCLGNQEIAELQRLPGAAELRILPGKVYRAGAGPFPFGSLLAGCSVGPGLPNYMGSTVTRVTRARVTVGWLLCLMPLKLHIDCFCLLSNF